MPTHIRALIVILVLAGAVLWLAYRPTTESAIAPQDYRRRAGVWLALTVLAFVTHQYWFYAFLTVPLLYLAGRKDANPLAMLFFVLYAIPPFPADVPSMGGLGNLLTLDHLRWLSIVVLFPLFMAIRQERGVAPFGSTAVDKAVLAYLLLWVVLQAMETSATNMVRVLLALFLDIFLPYYVASRALRNIAQFRDVTMSLLVAAVILGLTASFEIARSWLLYNGLGEIMGLPYWGMGNYTDREGGFLRAISTAGHPISLGYLLVVGMAMLPFLRSSITSPRMRALCWLVLLAGLIASMSRGPWVGGAVMLLVVLFTGPQVGSNLARAGLAAIVVVPLSLMTPQGLAVLDYLPWIGTAGSQTVEFRERLFDTSVQVLMHFPVFGSLTFLDHPDMQVMRGGDGIIDMVNTYLSVALSTGFVGLTFFVMPFLLVGLGIVRTLVQLKDRKDSDEYLLGRTLLAAIVGIMVTIGTTSSVNAIAITYYLVIGMGAAYLNWVAVSARQARTLTPIRPLKPLKPVAPNAARRPDPRRPRGVH